MKTAQFKDLKFSSIDELNEWLLETSSKQIILSDLGQDMQNIWVHESGEILNTDFNSSIYIGKFVNMEALSEFCPLEVWNESKQIYDRMMGLLVDEIRVLNN